MSHRRLQDVEIDERYIRDEPSMASKRSTRDGVLTLVGGFFIMLYLGCFFLWHNISVYVLSYFYYVNGTTDFSFVYLVDCGLVLFNLMGYQIGSYLVQSRRWHPKLVLTLGCLVSLLGNYASSLTTSISTYLLCYALMNGIGCGSCYLVPMICGWDHFPQRRGLVTGLSLFGFGFGSFIFSQISTAVVNPAGLDPIPDASHAVNFYPEEVAMRVPIMIRQMTYIWCFLVLIGICLTSRPNSN